MGNSLRIIAADDEPDIVQFYQDALNRLGHLVAVAQDGRRLVELSRTERPDLIITDVRMPGMGGTEAVRQVWREEPVPVILVSASPPADLVELASEGHVLGFLRKPVGLADLERAIALAVQGTQQPRREATGTG